MEQQESERYAVAGEQFIAALRPHAGCGFTWLTFARLELESAAERSDGDVALASRYDAAHVGSWHVHAWLHILRGEVAAAAVAVDGALALDRDFPETLGLSAIVAVLRRDHEQALASIERSLRLDPETLAGRYAQFLLLDRSGRHLEADAVIERLQAGGMF